MGNRRSLLWSILLSLVLGPLCGSPAQAHRSGCHRWHSCPSDRGTYICGDLGYCSGCPDNQYCLNRKPRSRQEQIPQDVPGREVPKSEASVQVVRVIDGDTIQVCCVFGDRVTISVSPTGSQGARGLLPEGFPPRAATALRRRTC